MKIPPQLSLLGYDEQFDVYRAKSGALIEQVARVVAEHKGAYEVASVAGELRALISGKRMLTATNRDDYPAVGDWVILTDNHSDTRVILDIIPRKTTLHKKYGGKDESQLIAANVDVALIVEAVDRDFSLNRFERYLVLAREGDVRPVIILNKSDLLAKEMIADYINVIRNRFAQIDVLTTSTVNGAGINQLVKYIEKGTTYCFLGSSGVGKSTLINNLLEQDRVVTKSISEKTGRGKHTTTSRELYVMNNGGIIIDNPGSREVGVVNSSDGLVEVFANIEDIAKSCKFKDCRHMNEPGCAVKNALNTDDIDESQYINYQKLRKESEHYEQNAYQKRQKDKEFGRFIKNAHKDIKRFKQQ